MVALMYPNQELQNSEIPEKLHNTPIAFPLLVPFLLKRLKDDKSIRAASQCGNLV